MHTRTTVLTPQSITATNRCSIHTNSANLAIAIGSIVADDVELIVMGSTSTTTVGDIFVTGNNLNNLNIDVNSANSTSTTIAGINGNRFNPAAVSIATSGTARLTIGAIGSLTTTNIGSVDINEAGSFVTVTGSIRIAGRLDINTNSSTSISGTVRAGSIEVNGLGTTRFFGDSTRTTSDDFIATGPVEFIGDIIVARDFILSGQTLFRIGQSMFGSTPSTIQTTRDFILNGPTTFTATVITVGNILHINDATQTLIIFPQGVTAVEINVYSPTTFSAAVTATFIKIYDTSTFTTGTHNISNSFEWLSGALSLGSSVLVVKRYLYLSNNGTFTSGTSIVRVGDYVGSTEYPGRTFGRIDKFGTDPFYVLQLVGDVILVDGSITTFGLSRTGNPNNFGETILTDSVTVTATGSGALTISGSATTNRMLVRSSTAGSPVTITATRRTLNNVDFKDITAAGGTDWTGTSLGNRLGNSGIIFTNPVTRFARGSGNWNSTAIWSSVSGGPSGASVPLPQDTVIINSLSGTGVINTSTARVLGANITIQTGYTGTLNFNSNVATNGVIPSVGVYGQLTVQPTNVTITATGGTTIEFYNRTIPLTLDYGNNSTIINTVVSTVTNTLTLAKPLGTAVNRTNILTINSGTVNTAGYDLHLASINGSIGTTIALTNSNVYVYNGNLTCYELATNTSNVYAMNLSKIQVEAGSFYNLYISNTLPSIETVIKATVGNLISSNHPTMPATVNFKLKGQFSIDGELGTLRIQNNIDLGSATARATFDDIKIYNDSTQTFQTQHVAYFKCTADGTYLGVKLTGFGLADLGGNSNIQFPSVVRAIAFSNVAAQSFTLPNDFVGSAVLIAIGGGGAGGVVATVGGAGGGGGGAYVASDVINLAGGQTIYVSSTQSVAGRTTAGAGTTGTTVWINTQRNVQPTIVLEGVSANGGSGGSSNGGGAGGISGISQLSIPYVLSGGFGNNGNTIIGSGGDGGVSGGGVNLSKYQLSYLNGNYVESILPTIGPEGGGAGGTSLMTINGQPGGIGAGGGGTFRTTSSKESGAGGPGLAVILYAYGRPSAYGVIIGQL